jgi:hypothetical protein
MPLPGRLMVLTLITTCCLVSLPLTGGEPARLAIPDAKAQAKIETLLQELFKDDYAKAQQDAASRARLAQTLLAEGRDTDDDRAGRFVLLREARDLAAAAGDTAIAFQAIEDLAKDFALPPGESFKMKTHALMTASKSVAAAESYYTVVDSALVLLEDALAADNFDAAGRLVDTAEAAAIKLRNVPLVSSVRKRKDDVARLQQDYAKWKPFAEALATNPKDPRANTEMGKYQAFRKGNWDVGLVLLARGDDPVLRGLAVLDLNVPKTAAAQVLLGEGWLAAATKTPEPGHTHLLLRAYYWLQQSLYQLGDNERRRVEKQMLAIMERVPPEFRVGEIVEEFRRYEPHSGPIYAVALSPDGRKAVFGGADNLIHLWDTRIGKESRKFDGHTGRVWAVAFSTDGRYLASGGFDKSIRIFDVSTGREKRLAGHKDYVRSVAFSRDGKRLISGGDDRVIRLWNLDSGEEYASIPGHDHFVWSVAISPDGTRALSGSLDKTVRLWDLATGNALKQFKHKDTVLSVAFSPDGRRALSGSSDGTLRLWDLDSGDEIHAMTGHKGYVHSVAFSPDGRRALSAGSDQVLHLWDLTSGEEIRRLDGHRDQVWCVAFSRDGRLAVSGGQDGSVRLWGGTR